VVGRVRYKAPGHPPLRYMRVHNGSTFWPCSSPLNRSRKKKKAAANRHRDYRRYERGERHPRSRPPPTPPPPLARSQSASLRRSRRWSIGLTPPHRAPPKVPDIQTGRRAAIRRSMGGRRAFCQARWTLILVVLGKIARVSLKTTGCRPFHKKPEAVATLEGGPPACAGSKVYL